MPYVSDDWVIINVQGLRTVRREDRPWAAPGSEWILNWSYKGQEHFYRYGDQAARDAMYEKLRAALTEKEQKQARGSYSRVAAAEAAHEFFALIRFDLAPRDAAALVEALEPIMRPALFLRSAVPCTPTDLDGDCYEEAEAKEEERP